MHRRRVTRSALAVLVSAVGSAWLYPAPCTAAAPTKNIYSFAAGLNATGRVQMSPSDTLAADAAGNLYGLMFSGGSSGVGSVFRLAAPTSKGEPWTEQTLYSFTGPDGEDPLGKPLLDASGKIYGVAYAGGAHNNGAIWRLSPPTSPGAQWTLTVLFSFPNRTSVFGGGRRGTNPSAGLVMDHAGTLYGTTTYGGTNGQGVAFSLAPPAAGGIAWIETVLHSFGGPGNGGELNGTPLTLSDHDNLLTGVSPFLAIPTSGFADDSGFVYRLRRSSGRWTYQVIYRFDMTNNPGGGVSPRGGVVVDRNDNIFGVTSVGGSSNLGTVFELAPPAAGKTSWTEEVLHSFTGPDGERPAAGLSAGGFPPVLFGTTYAGGQGGAKDGSSGKDGVTFKLEPPASGSGGWVYTALHAFNLPPRVRGEKYKYVGQAGILGTALTFGRDRFLFGVATAGGLHDSGTVFVQSPHR